MRNSVDVRAGIPGKLEAGKENRRPSKSQTAGLRTRMKTYFGRVFVKTIKTQPTVAGYVRAIDALELFLNRPFQIGQLRFELLDRWKDHLIAHGTPERTAYRYRHRILRVARHADPGLRLISATIFAPGTLMHFFKVRYEVERMIGAKKTSIELMEITLRRFDAFLGRRGRLEDLTSENVSKFVRYMLEEEKLARPTVNTNLGNLKALWNHAWHCQEVMQQPLVQQIPEYRELPVAWTVEELEQILRTCQRLEGLVGQWSAADWWTALVLFVYDTGLRISATLAVRLDGIDFQTGSVSVEAEFQKHRVAQRFTISEQCLKYVRCLRGPDRRFLFEFGRGRAWLYQAHNELLESAGLPAGRKRGFHCLRKTCASHIAAVAGIDAASKHLGHSGTELTKRYIDPRLCAERDATALLPRPKVGT